MSLLDWVVLIGSVVGIAAYGVWRTRGRRVLSHYLKGNQTTGWLVIGISVMATQASAITFISTPGQGYRDGLGFVQNYFGAPLALIVIAAIFLPMYRKLNVYTAYEFLGRRFDAKTRLLGAALFLVQRGFAAGITIYAPAIILSTVLHWRPEATIVLAGLVVTVYTAAGGSEAVNVTQKYQLGVIFCGMVAALAVLLAKLPAVLTMSDTLTLAGGFGKLDGVDFALDVSRRYTFWSGLLGGFFLALSYFGTDQSQVQRYLSGASLRESRLGLMFNAVFKIPMQFFILLLGALVFVFYQFEPPPVYFNAATWEAGLRRDTDTRARLHAFEAQYQEAHARKRHLIDRWLAARHSGDIAAARSARAEALAAHDQSEAIREAARAALEQANPRAKTPDTDYVFITFILRYLPHGVIGLLIAAFFAAALASKAAELNALASTTTVDFYQPLIHPGATDQHLVTASRCFTILWGLVAIAFALCASLAENLIQAQNIVGSIFYGVMLALFLVAFFLRWVRGTAVFWAAVLAQALVFVLYGYLNISYLWYNVIGCAACVLFSLLLQAALDLTGGRAEALPTP
jgi:Na+/proline symporter